MTFGMTPLNHFLLHEYVDRKPSFRSLVNLIVHDIIKIADLVALMKTGFFCCNTKVRRNTICL